MRALPRLLLGLFMEIRVVPVLMWSYTGITLGTALAGHARHGGVSVAWYALAIAIGVLLQGLVAHCANEIVDWRSGTDRDPAPRTLSGGSKVITAGVLTTRELAVLGLGAAVAAVAVGGVAIAVRGWELAPFGAAGLLGAVAYSLPPVRAAYRPFVGEIVAFACVWSCVAGAYVVQAGTLTGAAATAGAVHGFACCAMLMLHHDLDRGPDERASPPKRTTVVALGALAVPYATALALASGVAALGLAVTTSPAWWCAVAAAALAALVHARTRPGDVPAVTRAEQAVIGLALLGGLGTAVLLVPALWWALLPPVALVPLELQVSVRVHARHAPEGALVP